MPYDLIFTSLGLLACIGFGVVGFKRHFAEHSALEPRMIPWMVISLGSIATAFMLVVHLINLLGLETGRR